MVDRVPPRPVPRAWPVIPTLTRHHLLAGVVAGLIAGLGMALVFMIHAAIIGLGFWMPMRLIAVTFYGPDAVAAGAGAILVGVLIHAIVSGLFGLIFAAIIGPESSIWLTFIFGLVYGVVIWTGMTFLTLPLFNPLLLDYATERPGWWFFYHLVYGGLLFFTPIFSRSFAGLGLSRPPRRPAMRRLQ